MAPDVYMTRDVYTAPDKAVSLTKKMYVVVLIIMLWYSLEVYSLEVYSLDVFHGKIRKISAYST